MSLGLQGNAFPHYPVYKYQDVGPPPRDTESLEHIPKVTEPLYLRHSESGVPDAGHPIKRAAACAFARVFRARSSRRAISASTVVEFYTCDVSHCPVIIGIGKFVWVYFLALESGGLPSVVQYLCYGNSN